MADPFRQVAALARQTPDAPTAYWENELQLALKRTEKFRKDADRISKIYEAARVENNTYNILYANTETLLPSCYNQLPRPFVDRRFKDADPLGKAAAQALERTLSALEDTGNEEYPGFDDLMEEAVLSALVPGQGLTWFKYDADFEEAQAPVVDSEEGAEDAQGGGAIEGEALEAPTDRSADNQSSRSADNQAEPTEKVTYETICGTDLTWEEVLFGYARQWTDCPWVARKHEMTVSDVKANFGKEMAGKLKYTKPTQKDEQGNRVSDDTQEDNKGADPTAEIWEIWVKKTRKVLFLSREYKEGLLKEVDDPLELSGFFPCPRPLQFLLKKTTMVPTAIYRAYEEQAKELNRVSQRINRIISALKVRGFYDGSIQGLQDLMTKDDNTLIQAKNAAALGDNRDLDRAIWFMPLDMLIKVLQQLYLQREQVKGVIYEITGISDIMRGDTQASETYGAQNLKSQWGTLRLKKMQKRVQVYVRDCMRIMAEIAGKHFGVTTFAAMTNLDYATAEQVQQAQMTMQQVQQMLSMMPPPAPPQPGQPPAPPQMPPQMQQALQQAQAVLAKPQWEQVVGLLRNDLLRNYRVDIETNSTIDPNTSEDKQNLNEAMQAIASMYQSFLPAVQAGAMTMPTLKSILLTVARRFQFGREVEDAIAQMPDQLPPPPPDPSAPTPEEQQAKVAKAQLDAQSAQLQMQSDQQQAQADAQKRQLDAAKAQRDEQAAIVDHQNKMIRAASEQRVVAAKEQAAIAKAGFDTEMARLALEKGQRDAVVQVSDNSRKMSDNEAAKVENLTKKDKVRRDNEVHSAESKARIRKANTPEPAPQSAAPAASSEVKQMVADLIEHLKKPIQVHKEGGKTVIQRS